MNQPKNTTAYLFAFAAELSALKDVEEVGSTVDCAWLAEAVEEFRKRHGLEEADWGREASVV